MLAIKQCLCTDTASLRRLLDWKSRRLNWSPSRSQLVSGLREVGSLQLSVFHSFIEAKQAHFSEQSVEARVGLATLSHEASESDGVLLARHLALLVHLHLLATRQNDGD